MTRNEDDALAKRWYEGERNAGVVVYVVVALVMRFYFSPSRSDWMVFGGAFVFFLCSLYVEYQLKTLNRKLTRIENKLDAG